MIYWSMSSDILILKLGARSPEEAAKWIRSLQEAAVKVHSIPFTYKLLVQWFF